MPEFVLHQFPISHYCEKVRWVLDYKRLSYRVINQFPGFHMRTNRRLAGGPSVPVLIDGHHAVGDSSHIALYLDDQYPERQLIPRSSEERERVLALEAYFDEQAGPSVRRWIYGQLIARPPLFREVVFGSYDLPARALGRVLGGVVAKEIAAMYQIGPDSGAESLRQVLAAFARLEELIEGDENRYLIGDSLTLADITAASLLAALVVPPAAPAPWHVPLDLPEVLQLRAALRGRPGGRWLFARYARARR